MTRSARSPRILALAGLLGTAACEVDFVPRSEARDEVKKSYTLAAGGELTIENTNGRITVRPGGGPAVEIVATRIAKAGTDEAARKLLADTRIEETVTGSSVKLSSRSLNTHFGGTQYRVDYDIRAPAGLMLTLSATNGEIDVADWDGRVKMRATNGSLEATGLKGAVDASTTNGKIDIRMAQLAEAGITVETTNGAVFIELPKDARGRISARVTNGGISVDGLNVDPSPSNTRRRYEATLNGGGGPTVSVETTNGGISVKGR
jgi:hypothetical protein